jgi:hypothetical protein
MAANWPNDHAENWTFLMDQSEGMFQACPGATPMYVPPAFREDDLAALHATVREGSPRATAPPTVP